jgi:nucleoside-diphosphate-sugar epimerase
MRILVTGHNGYIGAVMVPILLDAGHDVVGLDTDLFPDDAFGTGERRIDAFDVDVRDVGPERLRGFDAVVHLAALSNDALSDWDPRITDEINHLAAVRLASLAKDAGVSRFLFASSCAIYGKAGDAPLDETAAPDPVTPYNISKVEVERDVSALADDGFSPTFMRNATVYGVSPRLNIQLVINNLVGWAYATGRVFIKSDGTPWRPIVHVEDVSYAFLAALEAPREAVHAQAINVGRNDENYAIRELADTVGEIVPGSHVEYAKDGLPEPRSYRVDFGKIGRLLPAFEPRWELRRGVEQLLMAYQAAGLSAEDVEGPRYIRMKQLQARLDAGEVDATLRPRRD